MQDFSYNFQAKTGNLSSLTNNKTYNAETFGYDNLNRLTLLDGSTIGYDSKGNITSKPGMGTYVYANSSKPYAVTGVTANTNIVPQRSQTVTYTSFDRPATITENNYKATFTCDASGERKVMKMEKNNATEYTRYYLSDNYEFDQKVTGTKEKLYLGGDYYTAPAVFVRDNGNSGTIYYICRDYLGSITHITTSSGSLVQELSYDAWGRLRNPSNRVAYTPGSEPALFLGRGYTGHEHLTQFGLINMNARLYDPAVGRFLSPDPYVQAPDFSQSFNRYSYALNNPLKYTDPSGEFWNYIIGAVIGGVSNLIANWGHIDNFLQGLSYFGIGAAVGVATAGIGSWSAGATQALGALPGAGVGALTGAVSGAASSFTLNGLNNVMQGQNFMKNWGSSLTSGAISGAVSGSISGGIKGYQNAKAKGANAWTGNKTISKNTYSASIKNGISAQTDPTKGCYGVVDEYASSGRENFTRTDFGTQAQADISGSSIPDAADPLVTYGNKTGKVAYAIENWETVGKGIQNGTFEAMGVVSNSGTNHAVNLVGLTVETKLNIFGGGVKQILNATTFWDPLIGRTTPGYASFIKVGYFKY